MAADERRSPDTFLCLFSVRTCEASTAAQSGSSRPVARSPASSRPCRAGHRPAVVQPRSRRRWATAEQPIGTTGSAFRVISVPARRQPGPARPARRPACGTGPIAAAAIEPAAAPSAPTRVRHQTGDHRPAAPARTLQGHWRNAENILSRGRAGLHFQARKSRPYTCKSPVGTRSPRMFMERGACLSARVGREAGRVRGTPRQFR